MGSSSLTDTIWAPEQLAADPGHPVDSVFTTEAWHRKRHSKGGDTAHVDTTTLGESCNSKRYERRKMPSTDLLQRSDTSVARCRALVPLPAELPQRAASSL